MGSRLPGSKPDRLAYWYFRLNGFLTTESFVIHPETGSEQRTDADVLGVRFAQRSEGGRYPLFDDPTVADSGTPINVIVAEVKTSKCSLNGPWTNPQAGNMREALRAIGCVPLDAEADATGALFRDGRWSDDTVSVRLFAVGEYRDPDLVLGENQQLIWHDIISFAMDRFSSYKTRKSAVGQWDADGQLLQKASLLRDEEQIRDYFKLQPLQAR